MELVYFLLTTLIFLFATARVVSAHCPLCTAGAGAGLALSRYLGVDDSITGIWIAAFLGATGLWLANTIKKNYLPFQSGLIYIAVFGLTLWSFYAFNLVDEHAGLIMGYPKVTVGIVSGGLVFYSIDILNGLIKRLKGKVLFAYQPIVFSLGAILLLSIGMFIFINYYI